MNTQTIIENGFKALQPCCEAQIFGKSYHTSKCTFKCLHLNLQRISSDVQDYYQCLDCPKQLSESELRDPKDIENEIYLRGFYKGAVSNE